MVRTRQPRVRSKEVVVGVAGSWANLQRHRKCTETVASNAPNPGTWLPLSTYIASAELQRMGQKPASGKGAMPLPVMHFKGSNLHETGGDLAWNKVALRLTKIFCRSVKRFMLPSSRTHGRRVRYRTANPGIPVRFRVCPQKFDYGCKRSKNDSAANGN